MNDGSEDAVVRGFAEDRMAAEAPRTRRNSSGDSRRNRVRSVTIIARRSKQSDRSESGCERPLRPRAFASEEARIAAETARTASEEARVATEAARHAVVDAVRATADASLEQMHAVEEMRRTLRETRDLNKLDSN